MRDEIGTFYVVTRPNTDRPRIQDICFPCDIIGMTRQIAGGLREEEIWGIYKEIDTAVQNAIGILDGMGIVVSDRDINQIQ